MEPLELSAAEAHDLGERVRGLGAGGGLGGQPLERVVLRGVVLAQAEQPGDGLGAEPRRRREAGPALAPSANALASGVSPSAATSRASRSWIESGTPGLAIAEGAVAVAEATIVSSPRVTVSSGRKAAGSCPSARISAAAHEAGLAAEATPAGTSTRSTTRRRRRRIRLPSAGSCWPLGSRPVRLVIQPTPDAGLRTAIEQAVGASNSPLLTPSAYRSRWRKAGLDYAAGRPLRGAAPPARSPRRRPTSGRARRGAPTRRRRRSRRLPGRDLRARRDRLRPRLQLPEVAGLHARASRSGGAARLASRCGWRSVPKEGGLSLPLDRDGDLARHVYGTRSRTRQHNPFEASRTRRRRGSSRSPSSRRPSAS